MILFEFIHSTGNGFMESKTMSLFCICVVPSDKLKQNDRMRQQATEELKEFAERYDDLGLFFNTVDMDRSLIEAPQYKDALKFYIADGKQYYNCEHLLRPDWYNEEEAEKYGTLEYRITKLRGLLVCALKYCDRLHLFIGNHGTLFERMFTRACSIQSFKDVIINEYERGNGFVPTIHLIVER